MSGPEKRAHERIAVRFTALVGAPSGKTLSGTVENLGVLGALIATPDLETPLDVGDRVTVSVERPGRESIDVAGKILRLDQEFFGGDIRRAFAVRFEEEVSL